MRGLLIVLVALLAALALATSVPPIDIRNECAPEHVQSEAMAAGVVYSNAVTAPLGATGMMCSCVTTSRVETNTPAYPVLSTHTLEGRVCTCNYEFLRATPAGATVQKTCVVYK